MINRENGNFERVFKFFGRKMLIPTDKTRDPSHLFKVLPTSNPTKRPLPPRSDLSLEHSTDLDPFVYPVVDTIERPLFDDPSTYFVGTSLDGRTGHERLFV